MNVPSISSALSTPATSAVGAVEISPTSPTRVESSAGPATTWWVSPPGQFFSLLHQVSQEYPVELMTALRAFADGARAVAAPTGDPDARTLAEISSELAHGAAPARRRGATGLRAYSPSIAPAAMPAATLAATPAVAPSAPLGRLLVTMQQLAQDNAAAFGAIASGLAGSFGSVAGSATGPGAEGMSTLAAQLLLSAQMATPDASRRAAVTQGASAEPGPAEVIPVEEEPPIPGSILR